MWVRVMSWKVKDGKRMELFKIWGEMQDLLDLPGPCRFFSVETGERDIAMWVTEAEKPEDLMEMTSWMKPGTEEALSALVDKQKELRVPGTLHNQILKER